MRCKQVCSPHSAPSPVLKLPHPLPLAFYLRFPQQSQDLPQIMQKSDQVEPVCGKGTYDLEAAGIKVGPGDCFSQGGGGPVGEGQVSPVPLKGSDSTSPTTAAELTLVRVGFPDALRSLERMKRVGEIYIRVRFIHQIV